MSDVFHWLALFQAYHDYFKEKLEPFLNHGHEVTCHITVHHLRSLLIVVEYRHNGSRAGRNLHIQSQDDLALVREVFEDLRGLILNREESFVNSQFENKYKDMLQGRDD